MYESYRRAYPTSTRDEFLGLTPRLYLLDMLAYHDAAQARREGSIYQSWLTAMLMGSPVPSFESLINPPPPPTVAEVIRTLRVEAPRRSWDEWLAK